MSFEIKWHTPYRVIDLRFWGQVASEEMQVISRHFVEMLAAGESHAPGRLVYLLYDTCEAESMPPSYLMLKEALPVLRFKNRGPMFHISNSQSMRRIVDLAAHVTRFPVRTFNTREDALRALEATINSDDLRQNDR